MTEIAISLMGRKYQIKCPESQAESLKQTAIFLEEKMSFLRTSGKMLSADQITTLTALEIAHDFLQLKNQMQSLQQKLDVALSLYVTD